MANIMLTYCTAFEQEESAFTARQCKGAHVRSRFSEI